MIPWADELSKSRFGDPSQNTGLGQGLPAQLKHSQMWAQSSRDSLWGLPCACDSSSLRNTQQPIVTMSPDLGAGIHAAPCRGPTVRWIEVRGS